jgi:predicted glycosyltransferase
MHPVLCQSRREILRVSGWIQLEFPGSKISLPYEESLWEALANCSHHITHESSTFFEASLVGIPTLYMNSGGKLSTHIPRELIELGLVFFDEDLVGRPSSMNKTLANSITFKTDFDREIVMGIFKEATLID